MFGFFVGAACLAGLFGMLHHGRHHGHYGRWGRHGRRHGGHFFLHRALERLDTTPGQEKVIRSAIHDLREEAWSLRGELKATRSDIAAALRSPELDRVALDRTFEKHDELLEKLRAALVQAMEQVHGTLDEQQRQKLADLLEAGPFRQAYC